MRFEALFAYLLVGIAAGNPLRLTDAYGNSGYDYGVQHPAGRSRVHVRTGGGNRNGNYYPVKHNTQSIPDTFYANSNSGPALPHPYRQEPSSNVPIYAAENSYSSSPVGYGHSSNYYPIYDQSLNGNYPQRHVIPQEYFGGEPFHGKVIDEIPPPVEHSDYSGSHIQQIADDSSLNYEPIEKLTLREKPSFVPVSVKSPADEIISFHPEPHTIQQTSDDLPLNFELNGDKHLDNPVVSQLTVDIDPSLDILDHKKPPTDEQVHIDQQSIDDFPIKTFQENIPDTKIVTLLTEPHLGQQEFVDVSPPSPAPISAVKYDTDDSGFHDIAPETFDVQAPLTEVSPISQSVLTDIPASHLVELPDSQEHLPVDELLVEDPPLPQSAELPPNTQQLIEVDVPLTKNAPSNPSVKLPPPSQEHLHIDGPFTKNPPPQEPLHIGVPSTKSAPSYPSVKLPPPPQEHLHVDGPFTKNSPSYPSVKLPPPAQEHLHIDGPFTKNPPSYPSVKLPPPPQEPVHIDVPSIKSAPSYLSVKLPPPPQEHLHVDGPFTKNSPSYPSVKLPPPAQEHLHIDAPSIKSAPSYPSVKLPPPSQEHLHIDGPFTKNPPSYPSVKLPPPPQEHLRIDVPSIKSAPSYPSVKLPPPPQEHLHVDGPFTKNLSPYPSVKLPPQEHLHVNGPFIKYPPSYPSVKRFPPPQEHLYVDGQFTKNLSPYPSVKLPPQKHLHVDRPFTKNSLPYPSVKLSPQEHLHVDGPFIKNPPSYSSIKLPPPPQEHLHVDGPFTKNPSPYPSVQLPPQEHLHVDGPLIKNPPSYSSVKLPPPSQEHLTVKGPFTKNPLPYPSVKLPPQEHLHNDGPLVQNPPSYSSVKLPPSAQEHLPVDGPFTKNPSPYPSVKLPPPSQVGPSASVSVKHPASSLLPESITLQENAHSLHPQESEDLLPKYPPVSHTIRLPSGEPKSLSPKQIGDNGSIDVESPLKNHTPVSHSVRLPIPDPASEETSVPNLFAAVPSQSDEAALLNTDIPSDSPVAEALVSGPIHPSEDLQELSHRRPISHSVRLPISSSRTSRNSIEAQNPGSSHFAGDERKQDFPAFPVESAFNQKDPVSDKVSDLTQGYRNAAGHDDSNYGSDEDESSDTSPSVNDARAEVDRINKEIGASFGDRLFANSRF